MTAGDDPRYVRVVCSKCRAVLHPRVEKAGRNVRCPDCFSAVLVPQPVPPEPEPKRRQPGEYDVRAALAPPRSEADSAGFFPVLCPKCQARLHPKRAHVGKRARCPDCDTIFVIPAPPAAEKTKPPPAPGKYAVGQVPNRVEPEFHHLIVDRNQDDEPEPLAPPETGWFVRGVFTFPWWPGAWARWTILSLLFLPPLLLVGLLAYLLNAHPRFASRAVRSLAFPLAWFWIWALSYAAACFTAIVQDTGSGNDEVADWPEGDWRDRVGTLLYLALHLGLALAAGAAVAWPLGMLAGPAWGGAVTALAANFFFPLFLLSSMEAASLVTVYSPLMFGSLLKTPGGWLVVYLESLGLLLAGILITGAAVLGTVLAGAYWLAMLAVLPIAPVLAMIVFIYARLYGRLAWHIGQLETKRKKKRRKKKDVAV